MRNAVADIGVRGGGVVAFRTPADPSPAREPTEQISSVMDFYTLEADSIHWANSPVGSLSRSDVVSVTWVAPGRDSWEGMKQGAIIGGGIGLAIGLIGGLSMTRECDPDIWFDLYCDVSTGEVIALSLGTAAAGALIYGLIGAAVGAKKQTIYRFRPDTPQQVSLVIGVGSSLTSRRQSTVTEMYHAQSRR